MKWIVSLFASVVFVSFAQAQFTANTSPPQISCQNGQCGAVRQVVNNVVVEPVRQVQQAVYYQPQQQQVSVVYYQLMYYTDSRGRLYYYYQPVTMYVCR